MGLQVLIPAVHSAPSTNPCVSGDHDETWQLKTEVSASLHRGSFVAAENEKGCCSGTSPRRRWSSSPFPGSVSIFRSGLKDIMLMPLQSWLSSSQCKRWNAARSVSGQKSWKFLTTASVRAAKRTAAPPARGRPTYLPIAAERTQGRAALPAPASVPNYNSAASMSLPKRLEQSRPSIHEYAAESRGEFGPPPPRQGKGLTPRCVLPHAVSGRRCCSEHG